MTNFEKLQTFIHEDEVKSLIVQLLGIDLNTRFSTDCYSQNVLFEFKYETGVKKPSVLAQCLYYLNYLKNHGEHIPPFTALINKDECAVFLTDTLKEGYEKDNLFVTGSPSTPSSASIDEAKKYYDTLYFYSEIENDDDLNSVISVLKDLLHNKRIVADKIKASNVKRAYKGYIRQLGDYIINQSASNGVFEFRADAIGKASIQNQDLQGNYTISFQFDNGSKIISNISGVAYDSYWKQWKRITDEQEANNVFKTIYDLLGMSDRRTKGQFYTPTSLAKEAWKRLTEKIGSNFWLDGSWRIWDCCAGTGNLEYDVIPETVMQYLYLSTLDIEEVDQLNSKFPLAKKIFQYDFLNNHPNSYPQCLKDDLENPNLKWLILINPPYAEAQGVTEIQSGVASSNVQQQMQYDNLGDAARDMFAQFLYRIEKELRNKYFLALFSPKKIISSKKYARFRNYFRPLYHGGFVVNAKEHFQCSGEWPIIFSLFDRRQGTQFDSEHWKNLNLGYDAFDKNCNITCVKNIKVYDKEREFRKMFDYIDFEQPIVRMPFLSSAIQLSTTRTYNNPLVTESFIATMQFIGSNLQQQDRCFIASGIINNNHNNVVINTNNYIKCLTGFGLFKSIDLNWFNKEDVMELPSRELTEEEVYDCVLYGLLSKSNQTATYRFSSGEIITNKLNPMDETLFDFSKCSELGKQVFALLKDYLENKVNYKNINTRFGKGKFLGLYQYQMDPDADHLDCFGIKYSSDFNDKIEELRQRVSLLAEEVCF